MRVSCLGQRLADRAAMEREIAVWTATRATTTCRIDWQFTTADARFEPRHLYPSYDA